MYSRRDVLRLVGAGGGVVALQALPPYLRGWEYNRPEYTPPELFAEAFSTEAHAVGCKIQKISTEGLAGMELGDREKFFRSTMIGLHLLRTAHEDLVSMDASRGYVSPFVPTIDEYAFVYDRDVSGAMVIPSIDAQTTVRRTTVVGPGTSTYTGANEVGGALWNLSNLDTGMQYYIAEGASNVVEVLAALHGHSGPAGFELPYNKKDIAAVAGFISSHWYQSWDPSDGHKKIFSRLAPYISSDRTAAQFLEHVAAIVSDKIITPSLGNSAAEQQALRSILAYVAQANTRDYIPSPAAGNAMEQAILSAQKEKHLYHPDAHMKPGLYAIASASGAWIDAKVGRSPVRRGPIFLSMAAHIRENGDFKFYHYPDDTGPRDIVWTHKGKERSLKQSFVFMLQPSPEGEFAVTLLDRDEIGQVPATGDTFAFTTVLTEADRSGKELRLEKRHVCPVISAAVG